MRQAVASRRNGNAGAGMAAGGVVGIENKHQAQAVAADISVSWRDRSGISEIIERLSRKKSKLWPACVSTTNI